VKQSRLGEGRKEGRKEGRERARSANIYFIPQCIETSVMGLEGLETCASSMQ
jgi:hypothetical protein